MSATTNPNSRPNRNNDYTTRILTAASLLAMMLIFSGCASTPAAAPDVADPVAETSSNELDQLLARAARSSPRQASALYLQAAWQFFTAGDLESAESTAALVERRYLSPQDQMRQQLLEAELAIAAGDTERADQLLAGLDLNMPASPEVAARLCAHAEEYVCAANQLIASSGEHPARNNSIWRYLGLAPANSVSQQAATTSDPIARAWWQLKLATLRSHSLSERQQAITFWRSAWPQHPAAVSLPDALAASLNAATRPQQLALLLPLSGPLAGAGEAVRDGIVSGYIREQADSGILLRFYDTESAPLPQLYEQILDDGNELIIGPLRKALVDQFNALNPQLPVLALNYLDDRVVAAPALSQLGLAIEDEAASITQALEASGVESLLVFHNYEDWSLRARRALADSWTGRLTVTPFTDIRTITEAVGNAMDVEASQDRHDQLSRLFSEDLEFLPRARQDIQAIVALIDNVEANALVPALQFHFADQLPVYASSQVVRGARRSQLTELGGFLVSELPWYVTDDRLFAAMREPFALDGNRFSALYALGADALRIALMLDTLPRDNSSVMLGSTGAISLHRDGRFHRELSWASVRGGEVTAATPADRASSD